MIGAAIGFLVVSGLVLIAGAWLVGRSGEDEASDASVGLAQRAAEAARRRRKETQIKLRDRLDSKQTWPIGIAAAVAVVVFAVTRWPVAALGGGAIGYVIVMTLTGSGATNVAARAEGVAIWVETMRDLTAGGLGLESAIMTACRTAPDALTVELAELVVAVERRDVSVREGIAATAGRIRNPTADIAVAVLLLTLQGQASRPVEVLSQLARDARDQVSRIAEIEAARASARTTMRMMMVVMGAGIGVFFLFGRSYLEPYGTIAGQFILAIIMGVLVFSFSWMRKLIAIKELPRVIMPETMAI